MALGIVADNEFEEELERLSGNKPAQVNIVTPKDLGRGDKEETPESVRKVIAEESINGADRKELARLFNVSDSSVSAYKHGNTSTSSYDKPVPSLAKHIDNVKGKIVVKAKNRLVKALNSITDEKIENLEPRAAAGLARDMSAIIREMEPDVDESNKGPAVTFNFFAPRMREEDAFEVVQVNE